MMVKFPTIPEDITKLCPPMKDLYLSDTTIRQFSWT